jgi:hypothetical protein
MGLLILILVIFLFPVLCWLITLLDNLPVGES